MREPFVAQATLGVIQFSRQGERTLEMSAMGSQDIAADIAKRIVQGEWPKGGRLPTTSALAQEYNVHANTVYDAMNILKIRGIVVGVRGGGRYVA